MVTIDKSIDNLKEKIDTYNMKITKEKKLGGFLMAGAIMNKVWDF